MPVLFFVLIIDMFYISFVAALLQNSVTKGLDENVNLRTIDTTLSVYRSYQYYKFYHMITIKFVTILHSTIKGISK